MSKKRSKQPHNSSKKKSPDFKPRDGKVKKNNTGKLAKQKSEKGPFKGKMDTSVVHKSKQRDDKRSKEGTKQKNKQSKFSKPWKNKKKEEDTSDFEEVEETKPNTNQKDSTVDSTEDGDEAERRDVRKLVTQQNKKNKKSGGFQSLGLSYNVYKGIIRKGYKVPTPIQRKTLPIIMDGKDVVAMARTGSGKTAAFLIPMFEKLQTHVAKSGARALVLSPTRELAVQTLKFAKELGKFTGLRAAVVLGGDRMEDQFAALHENPDIIIATPGRFMHVVVEMNLKLLSVEYVVFDEADRLFEMGFQEQLSEILNRLPETRQTLLFSATLPKLLVDFAKAGLHDPTLIRLDVDTKLSEQLKMSFVQCRPDDKLTVLLYLLTTIIKFGQQTVVFAATKHHVEYIHLVLQQADISSTYIYSSLDQTARKINIAKFQHRKAFVLVVTDLAARGIDIPLLDNVINYHFPPKPKLFVHRVGRVARAGRSGVAFSLIAPEEIPYVLDLHVFLGRSLKYVPSNGSSVADEDGLYGQVPQSVIDDSAETLLSWHTHNYDIEAMVKVCKNAYGQYVRSRPAPAQESVKRCKEMGSLGQEIGIHPIFGNSMNSLETERLKILNALKSFKSDTTIFEINSTAKNVRFDVMKSKRAKHQGAVQSKQGKMAEHRRVNDATADTRSSTVESADSQSVQDTFSVVIGGKRAATDQSEPPRQTKKQRREQESVRDEEFYISYRPADYQSEQGLRLGSSFDREASSAILDVAGDDDKVMQQKQNALKWDRKKKKYVRQSDEDPKKKKIRTESGAWISASYKSNVYKEWMQKTKRDVQSDLAADDDDDDGEAGQGSGKSRPQKKSTNQNTSSNRLMVFGGDVRKKHRQGTEEPGAGKQRNKFKTKRSEIRRPEQIMKTRKVKAHKEYLQNKRTRQRSINRAVHGRHNKGKG